MARTETPGNLKGQSARRFRTYMYELMAAAGHSITKVKRLYEAQNPGEPGDVYRLLTRYLGAKCDRSLTEARAAEIFEIILDVCPRDPKRHGDLAPECDAVAARLFDDFPGILAPFNFSRKPQALIHWIDYPEFARLVAEAVVPHLPVSKSRSIGLADKVASSIEKFLLHNGPELARRAGEEFVTEFRGHYQLARDRRGMKPSAAFEEYVRRWFASFYTTKPTLARS